MGIQEFIEALMTEIREKNDSALNITASDIVKLNDTMLHAITITREGRRIGSIIYIDEYYTAFQNGRSLEDIANRIMKVYYETDQSMNIDVNSVLGILDFNQVKDKITFKLVSKERNEEYLRNKCYKEFLDMIILYMIELSSVDSGIMTIAISNDILKNWDVSSEELFDIAYENTFRLHSITVKSIMDVLREIRPDAFENDFAQFMNPPELEANLQVMTFDNNINGATCLVNKDVWGQIADEKGFDEICIIPSSIHELLLVERTDETDTDCLNDMVCQVNATEVSRDEILSNHIYIYKRVTNEINCQ